MPANTTNLTENGVDLSQIYLGKEDFDLLDESYYTPWGYGELYKGSMWAAGANANGQLGDNSFNATSSPVQVAGSNTTWYRVGGGEKHSLGIRTDRTLWAWGLNTWGQLGLNSTATAIGPQQIGTDTNWQSISHSGGMNSSFGIKTNSTLWAWGQNSSGRLGLGNTNDVSTPVQIGALNDWKFIGSGSDTVALKKNGTIWAWGPGGPSSLFGDGATASRSSPVQMGSVSTWGKIAVGDNHVMAIRTNGTLWTWGTNSSGQLGLGTTTYVSTPVQVGTNTNWKDVACGNGHTIAITNDGELFTWGSNAYGELGLGDRTARSIPVQVGALTDWASVSPAGPAACAVIKNNGTLWTWGQNSGNSTDGILGHGDITHRSSPVQVGALTTWRSGRMSKTHLLIIKG